jgi:hypothetical protein
MKELSDAGSMPAGSGILEEGKHQGELAQDNYFDFMLAFNSSPNGDNHKQLN